MTKPAPARSVSVVRTLITAGLLAGLLGLAGAGPVGAATPAQVVRANRQAAVTAADQILGELVLPPGATEVPDEPKGDAHRLARSIELFFYAASVDRHDFWTTTASPSAVIASIEAHLPAGAKSGGSGYDSTSMFASYSLPIVDAPALGQRSFDVDAVELADGTTGVRADAAVSFYAPRLRAQQVPPEASVLDVTIANYPSKPLLSLAVTNRSRVRRIAQVVDDLPLVANLRGVALACPAIMVAPLDTLTFRSSPSGPALATVSEPADNPTDADPCFAAPFTIRGHREPGLLEGGMLLRQAGAILGVKLTRRTRRPGAGNEFRASPGRSARRLSHVTSGDQTGALASGARCDASWRIWCIAHPTAAMPAP